MARDDLLMELHRQPQQSPTDKNVCLNFSFLLDLFLKTLANVNFCKFMWKLFSRFLFFFLSFVNDI